MGNKHNEQVAARAIRSERAVYFGFVPMKTIGARRCDYSGVCEKPATYTIAGRAQIGICEAHAAVVGSRLRIG